MRGEYEKGMGNVNQFRFGWKKGGLFLLLLVKDATNCQRNYGLNDVNRAPTMLMCAS